MSDDGAAGGATRDDEGETGTAGNAGTGVGARTGVDPASAGGQGPATGPRSGGVGGRRFVAVLYLLLVAFAAVAGVLFARVVADPEPPRLLFVVPLPPTSLGFAVYGGLTVALVLGVPLALVVYVSRRAGLAAPPKE